MASSNKNPARLAAKIKRHEQDMAKSDRRRKLATERKKYRRNQQPRGPRQRDWIPANLDLTQLDEWDDSGYEDFERIMPLDEADRRTRPGTGRICQVKWTQQGG